MNWHLGGLRDPDCFFAEAGDATDQHIAAYGLDEPSLN